ncbi:hypothetical protein PR048_032237 [Dryococelus australis]|uniref:Uncharacterized protein n=1 Tax=Dryococelus australis TaxID=614101 RepID=A0ABQ9G1M4_9NEOP|nr:hypothetical protein PR048_032237 [Dryococelus australis]
MIPLFYRCRVGPRWSSGFFECGNRVGRCSSSVDFLRDLPSPPPLHSDGAPYSRHSTLIGSQDLDGKSRPNLFHSLGLSNCCKGMPMIADLPTYRQTLRFVAARTSRRHESEVSFLPRRHARTGHGLLLERPGARRRRPRVRRVLHVDIVGKGTANTTAGRTIDETSRLRRGVACWQAGAQISWNSQSSTGPGCNRRKKNKNEKLNPRLCMGPVTTQHDGVRWRPARGVAAYRGLNIFSFSSIEFYGGQSRDNISNHECQRSASFLYQRSHIECHQQRCALVAAFEAVVVAPRKFSNKAKRRPTSISCARHGTTSHPSSPALLGACHSARPSKYVRAGAVTVDFKKCSLHREQPLSEEASRDTEQRKSEFNGKLRRTARVTRTKALRMLAAASACGSRPRRFEALQSLARLVAPRRFKTDVRLLGTGMTMEISVTAMAERFAYSPPTRVKRVQSPAGSLPDSRMWGSCWTMPLVDGFSRGRDSVSNLQPQTFIIVPPPHPPAIPKNLQHYATEVFCQRRETYRLVGGARRRSLICPPPPEAVLSRYQEPKFPWLVWWVATENASPTDLGQIFEPAPGCCVYAIAGLRAPYLLPFTTVAILVNLRVAVIDEEVKLPTSPPTGCVGESLQPESMPIGNPSWGISPYGTEKSGSGLALILWSLHLVAFVKKVA